MPRCPRGRLLLVLAAIVGCLLVDRPLALAFAFAVPAILLMTEHQRLSPLGKRVLAVAPLILLSVIAGVLQNAPLAGVLTRGLRIVAAVTWSSWLSATLTPGELDHALHSVGLPRAFVELVSQTRRFGSQLVDTLRSTWSAAALRGGTRSVTTLGRMIGQVAGVVVVRALDRSETVAVASLLRGSHVVLPAQPGGEP